MPSSLERAAMSKALRLLSARERNVLTVHRQHGMAGLMELLKADRPGTQAELDRIKLKLQVAARRELRKPPEDAGRAGSSLAPPDGPLRRDGPVLRSSGMLSPGTPGRPRARFKEKDCQDCGSRFMPQGSRQVKCPECRGEAPVVVRHDESVIVERPVEESALDAAGVEVPEVEVSSNGHLPKPYPLLRAELDTIRAQLDDFAAGIDRLMEGST